MRDPYHWADSCPNCGQEGAYKGGRRTSTDWGHGVPCCSNACGFEYAAKLHASTKPDQVRALKAQIARLEDDMHWGYL